MLLLFHIGIIQYSTEIHMNWGRFSVITQSPVGIFFVRVSVSSYAPDAFRAWNLIGLVHSLQSTTIIIERKYIYKSVGNAEKSWPMSIISHIRIRVRACVWCRWVWCLFASLKQALCWPKLTRHFYRIIQQFSCVYQEKVHVFHLINYITAQVKYCLKQHNYALCVRVSLLMFLHNDRAAHIEL